MEDTIYKAIPEYLDEKQLEASGTFIEEYQTDPVTTPEDKFVIHDLRAAEIAAALTRPAGGSETRAGSRSRRQPPRDA